MPAGRLSLRELNRATLERQLLLRREAQPALAAIRHLAGLQAQAPLAPYVGLQARLAGFGPGELKDLLTGRTVVRAHLMRNTVHLVTAADFVTFRPLLQPVLDRALAGNFGRRLAGVDLARLQAVARPLLARSALTRTQLGEQLAAHWPGHEPAALAYAATHLLPLVQVPPRGLWGGGGPATWFLAAAWLDGQEPGRQESGRQEPGRQEPVLSQESGPPDPAQAVAQLVLRYLGAYGPATVADIQAWSGLSRLREVTERLGSRLRPLAGPDGAELLDLPDAPRPGPDVPAPPRFLPEYDNLLLSFADRGRVIRPARPVPLPPGNGASAGTVLVDGFWAAEWAITRGRGEAVLEVRPFTRLDPGQLDAVTAEGRRLLSFAAPTRPAHDIRIISPDPE